ncbi:hypothetical protein ANCCEY_09278 [Ancylostoma ceylanicum]|uniref:Attacin C-terminal domain-containing protein n=1 Tax=Ancylostoma ceylanicum TaxID=53326 RepID=A0A0D6LVG2_9BILA|nr:hypothetical protein ANCCEY_09278 [Ancylostoma ceylanicum]
MKFVILAVLLFTSGQSFKIPFGFGGISVDRTQNNELALGIQRGVNVLGNGYERNTGLTIGNGTFSTSEAADVLVGGTRSGPRSSLGLTKDGFNIGGNVAVQTKPKNLHGVEEYTGNTRMLHDEF